jgi:nucleoside 2-deoxyribosyltransferase
MNAEARTCFVLMPFRPPFDGYYREVIVPAIEAVGLTPVRADEVRRPGSIMGQIFEGIRSAAVCVADLTGNNPNVMYELGIAHALHKPVAQLVQTIDDLPFDLRHLRHLVYRTDAANWAVQLRADLEAMLRAALADRQSAVFLPGGDQRQWTSVDLLLTKYELEHLRRLASAQPRLHFQKQAAFETELRHLEALELIERLPGPSISRMPRQGDLRQFFRLTEKGSDILRLA